jgi:hypothetical protein
MDANVGTGRTDGRVLVQDAQDAAIPRLPLDLAQEVAVTLHGDQDADKLGLLDHHPLIGHAKVDGQALFVRLLGGITNVVDDALAGAKLLRTDIYSQQGCCPEIKFVKFVLRTRFERL